MKITIDKINEESINRTIVPYVKNSSLKFTEWKVTRAYVQVHALVLTILYLIVRMNP